MGQVRHKPYCPRGHGVCILASLVYSFYAITNKLLHIPFNTYVGFFYGVVFTAMAIHIYNVCRPKN